MRKHLLILLALAMFSIPAAVSHANDTMYNLVGRELSPGIKSGGVYYGALFLGEIFDAEYTRKVGYFSVLLNREDEGVEECGETTTIINVKLIMNFNNGSRLVLVLNQDEEAMAEWDYDDPACPGGCLFPGYATYIFDVLPDLEEMGQNCGDDGDDISLIAKVPDMTLTKQRFGSWGIRGVSGATLNGWLVHTPLLIPAVFGTVTIQ